MSTSSSARREARRAMREQAHRERKALRKKLMREFDEAVARDHQPSVELRWWYRPAVAVLSWWWALTRQPFKSDTIRALIRRAAVLS